MERRFDPASVIVVTDKSAYYYRPVLAKLGFRLWPQRSKLWREWRYGGDALYAMRAGNIAARTGCHVIVVAWDWDVVKHVFSEGPLVHGLLLPWPGPEEIRRAVEEQTDVLLEAARLALRGKAAAVGYKSGRLFVRRVWPGASSNAPAR